MPTKISSFDVSEYLKNEETIAEYLSAVIEEGDTQLLLSAIGDIAKARGMATYKALNPEAKPRFETIIKVLSALGVSIVFNPKIKKSIPPKKIKKHLVLHAV